MRQKLRAMPIYTPTRRDWSQSKTFIGLQTQRKILTWKTIFHISGSNCSKEGQIQMVQRFLKVDFDTSISMWLVHANQKETKTRYIFYRRPRFYRVKGSTTYIDIPTKSVRNTKLQLKTS